jgi:predicted HTH transcriptional regulator
MKLPDLTDDAKKEFLADISSFANASGGDIIYGSSSVLNQRKMPAEKPPMASVRP